MTQQLTQKLKPLTEQVSMFILNQFGGPVAPDS